MSILSDAVFSSVEWNGRGMFNFDRIPFRVKMTLKSTTKRQMWKFRKKGIVPVTVLEALWFLGFLPGVEAPKEGMRVLVLTEYLRLGEYRNEMNFEKGQWLYKIILKEEVVGVAKIRRHK
jgi:hypothetical protein